MTLVFDKPLSEWIDGLSASSTDVSIEGICQDSRLCVKGDAYLALKGATTHGYRFAQAAVEKGAVAVLVNPDIAQEHLAITQALNELKVPVVEIADLDQQASRLAAEFYDHPSQSLKVIAVTGTDGKTSVCQFVKNALNLAGFTCGYIGTLGWGVGKNNGNTALTTPDAVALQRMLATMRQEGADAVAMEASSHGIAEGRLIDINIDIAVLTNLGRDHLDYHVTEEAYSDAKAQLFCWPSLTSIVVNGDDALGKTLMDEALEKGSVDVHVFSGSAVSEPAYSYLAKSIHLSKAGLQFELIDGPDTFEVVTPLYGRFNVENLSACHAVLRACGVAANDSADALAQLGRVPGRMEPFTEFAQPTVIVDFAHTPQALEFAITAVREHTQGLVWVVFGCGGDRDPGKRILMAQAAEMADHVIVTDDNPRNENPAHIRLMIVNGFSTPSAALEIGNRERAIQYAIWHAQPDDVVLVAGKGHEDYQIVGNQVFEYSDRDAVAKMLKEAV